MRPLIYFFVIFISAVVIGLLAYQDSGYVLIGRGTTTLEMSLTLFITLIILGFSSVYFLIRLLARTWTMPTNLRLWRQHKRSHRARVSSSRGLIELAEGHWRQAERALIRNVKDSETPLLNYLSAARAAQKQNAHERRDHYLSLAHSSTPDADMAVELTQAELQMAHGQYEQSLATLVHLRDISPKHPHVLILLAQLYEKLQSWADLQKLLPQLHKQKIIDETRYRELSVLAFSRLMAINAHKPNKLEALWQQIPRELRQEKQLLREYAQHLIELQQYDSADVVIRDALRRSWDQHLVYLYGYVRSSQPEKQLQQAEAWLKGRDNNPLLLLSLGRIAIAGNLWGKARAYLEASIGHQATAEAYKELGQLLEQLEEHEAASQAYRSGLMISALNTDYQPPQLQLTR